MSEEIRAVVLQPMSEGEYACFAHEQVEEYTRQLLHGGIAPIELAREQASNQLAGLKNNTLHAEGHSFLSAHAHDRSHVGSLWHSPAPAFLGAGHQHTRWLSQITVTEPVRGRGWGRVMLGTLEAMLAREAVEQLWLRVFDWNAVARRLYESAGYELVQKFETDAHYRKRLAI